MRTPRLVISACLLAAFSSLAFAQAKLAPTPMLQFLDSSSGIADAVLDAIENNVDGLRVGIFL
jgi:hypothetical protein